jgi:hypothetical protein
MATRNTVIRDTGLPLEPAVNVTDYLLGGGSGADRPWHVPDLVPPGGAAELVFVFESPHVEELKARLPVAGAAGRSALRFLLPNQPKDLSLGQFVDQSHQAGHGRIAILNVSNVPMQAAAFVDGDAPDLRQQQWALLEKVRRSTARSVSSMRGHEPRAVTEQLVVGLRDRLSELATTEGSQVVAAGIFAQRVMAAASPDLLSDLFKVPHPSFNQWNRLSNQVLPSLVEVRRRFRACADGSNV